MRGFNAVGWNHSSEQHSTVLIVTAQHSTPQIQLSHVPLNGNILYLLTVSNKALVLHYKHLLVQGEDRDRLAGDPVMCRKVDLSLEIFGLLVELLEPSD